MKKLISLISVVLFALCISCGETKEEPTIDASVSNDFELVEVDTIEETTDGEVVELDATEELTDAEVVAIDAE